MVKRGTARWTSLLAAWISAAALVGCSSEETGGGSGGAGSGSGTGGSGAGNGGGSGGEVPEAVVRCCLDFNGVKSTYACPDEAAAQTCIGVDPAACIGACAPEDQACRDACIAGGQPDPSGCDEVDAVIEEWCKPPPPPGSDCTAGNPTCEDASDCFDKVGPGTWCNSVTNRCFDIGANCVGTPCAEQPDDDDGDGRDCGSGDGSVLEVCSNDTGKCEYAE